MNKIIKYLFFISLLSFVYLEEMDSIKEKQNLAMNYIESGLYEDANIIYENILNIKKDILGNHNVALVETLHDLYNINILMDNTKLAEFYLKEALHLQYINFLFTQKKYLPTLIKFQELYSYQKDTLKSTVIDSLIFELLNMNKDSSRAFIDTSIVYPDIILLQSTVIDSSNLVSEYSLNDKAIEFIEMGLSYLNMGVYSETAKLFDNALKVNSDVLNLEYLLNINYNDSLAVESLYNTFTEIEQFDSSITTQNFFLAILDIKRKGENKKIRENLRIYSGLYRQFVKANVFHDTKK